MTLPQWIRAARKFKGWSQEKLGEELGLTKGNVSAWETDRHEPSYGQMKKIAELTGYPFLDSDIGKATGNWPLSDDVLAALRRAKPETRSGIETYARFALGLPAVESNGKPQDQAA